MFLYPYKIFSLSKGKRLINPENKKLVGVHDAYRNNYDCCSRIATFNDYAVSVLLGLVNKDTRLICLDLDDCYNSDGELEPLTKELLKEFKDEEWETSSGGEGIHVYILTKLDLETFIVKDLEGSKSFECYTRDRHIVTTTFDFENTNLRVGVHDKFLTDLYSRVQEIKNNKQTESQLVRDCKELFDGEIVKTESEVNGKIYKRKPVTDMFTLRGLGYKDANLIQIIDEDPTAVDQSAHDAKLIRKLMYYTLSFDDAWEMAKKTNYYKAKDDYHKKKFDNDRYKENTRRCIYRGKI